MRQFPILLILASAILSCGGNDPVNPGTDTIPPVPTPSCSAPKFLTDKITLAMFDFPEDLKDIPAKVNYLHDQALVRYYDREWQAMMLQ